MPRQCPICERPPREGEEMRAMRLRSHHADDFPGKEVGLYHACNECVDEFKLIVADELNVEPGSVTNYMLC